MAATKGGSLDRLLDSAECVFAQKGYDAATTREIAARSGDTLGTLSYHFKSKETLLLEVLTRRFDEMNDQRRAMYRDFAAKRNGDVPTLDEAVTAIVLPVMKLALTSKPGWRDYITILCRLVYVVPEEHGKIISQILDPIGVELLGWLKAACPPASHANVAYAHQFIIGCMLDSVVQARNDRVKRISDGAASATDFPAVSERLIPFLVAGTKSILDLPADGARRRGPPRLVELIS